MMMSQKSGFTSTGLWNILNLLGKIPKVITVRLTFLTHPVRMRPNFQGLPWFECEWLVEADY